MIKNIEVLESALGLQPGEFKTLYEDKEEKEIPVSSYEIIKKEDYATRIANTKTDSLAAGKAAAIETTAKELKKNYGIEVDGKDLFKVVSAIVDNTKTKTLEEAKIEPTAKVKELQTDLATMKGNYEKVLSEKSTLETTYKQKEKSEKINSTILKDVSSEFVIPKDKATRLALEEAAANGISVDLNDEGQVVFKKGDEIMKDTNLVPIKAGVALKDYFAPYAKKVEGGGGGVDNPASGAAGSYAHFEKEMIAAGKNPGSLEFNREMQSRIRSKTLKM